MSTLKDRESQTGDTVVALEFDGEPLVPPVTVILWASGLWLRTDNGQFRDGGTLAYPDEITAWRELGSFEVNPTPEERAENWNEVEKMMADTINPEEASLIIDGVGEGKSRNYASGELSTPNGPLRYHLAPGERVNIAQLVREQVARVEKMETTAELALGRIAQAVEGGS